MLTNKAKWFLKFDNESAVMFMTGCVVLCQAVVTKALTGYDVLVYVKVS